MNQKNLNGQIARIASGVGRDTPGFTLLIGQGENILYHKGFGMSNIENQLPNLPDTRYLISSLSKTFTSMAILMLKEQKLVDYDDTVGRFFPDFPDYKKKVTLRHLLTHTSGIKEYVTKEFEEGDHYANVTEKDVLELIRHQQNLNFEPGSKFEYGNSGYMMLGVIVERITGIHLSEFLKTRVFETLGMERTVAYTSMNQRIDDLAVGYEMSPDNKLIRSKLDMVSIGRADGNIVSTVGDLFKWYRALQTNQLVSKDTLKTVFSPYVLNDGTISSYGFGWYIDQWHAYKKIGHMGYTGGYTSRLEHFIEEDIVMIMATNRSDAETERGDRFFEIAKLFMEK